MKPGQSSGGVLLVLSMAMFCAMLGVGVISPILPLFARELGASGFLLGLIFGSFSFSRSVGMFISGELAEHVDRKILLLAGLSVYALSSVAYTFAGSTSALILIRLGHGFGSAMVVPITMAVGADIAAKGEEGLFFGTLQGALFLGIGFGPLLSGVLADMSGIKAPFLAMTALTVLSLAMVARFLPFSRSGAELRAGTGMASAMRGLMTDHVMVPVFIFQFCSAMTRGTLLMMIPLFAAGLNLSFTQIGVILSLNSLSTGILQRFSGRLADRLRKNRLIFLGGIIPSITLLGLPFLRTPVSLSLASIAFGVGHAFSSPSLAAVAALRSRTYGSGRTMGLFNISFSLGMSAGPVIAGTLLDISRSEAPFFFLSAMLASASVLFLVGRLREI